MSLASVWAQRTKALAADKPASLAHLPNPPWGGLSAEVTDKGDAMLSASGTTIFVNAGSTLRLAAWLHETFREENA